jgi:hypothetical protein
LAYIYATGQGQCFAKVTTLSAGNGGMQVHRQRLHPHLNPQRGALQQQLCRENVVAGKLYSTYFNVLLNTGGWTIQAIADWATPWLTHLEALSIPSNVPALPNLPGDLLDCCPLNMVQQESGTFEVFDLEWRVASDVPLVYVLMRGLVHCFLQLKSVAQPAAGTPTRILDLAADVMDKLGYALSDLELQAIWGIESMFFGRCDGTLNMHVHVRANPIVELQQLRRLQAQQRNDANFLQAAQGGLAPAPKFDDVFVLGPPKLGLSSRCEQTVDN